MTHARIVAHVIRWLVAVLTLLAAAEVATGAEVKGRVVDPQGEAVKRAKVYLVQSKLDENAASQPALSDGEGNFTLTTEVEPKGQRDEMVVAAAERFGIVAAYPQKGKPLQIKLEDAIEVTVPFMDEEGRPVRDLPIRTHQLSIGGIANGWFFRPPRDMPLLSGRTDGNGEVILRNCPRGGRLWLALDDERFVKLSYETVFILSNEETMRAQPIKLVRAGSVKGRVTFPDGKPASDLRVAASPIHPNPGWSMDHSDGDGFYHLKQLGAGNYNISITIQDEMKKSWTVAAREVSLSVGEQRRDVDLKLVAGGVIKGKVMAQDSGEGIAKVYVGLHGPAHPQSSSQVDMTYTSEDGSYSLRTPPGEQYVYLGISVPPEGFGMPKETSRTLSMADGQTVEVDFKLPRGPKIPVVSGRVVDEDGKAVRDCAISIEPSGKSDFSASAYQVQSTADGSFQFKLLYPEAKVRAKKSAVRSPASLTAGERLRCHLPAARYSITASSE